MVSKQTEYIIIESSTKGCNCQSYQSEIIKLRFQLAEAVERAAAAEAIRQCVQVEDDVIKSQLCASIDLNHDIAANVFPKLGAVAC